MHMFLAFHAQKFRKKQIVIEGNCRVFFSELYSETSMLCGYTLLDYQCSSLSSIPKDTLLGYRQS